jgi:hypothetical protein
MVLLFNPMYTTAPWTPAGVPFELHTQFPNLESLEPDAVIALFSRLLERTANHAQIRHVTQP